MRAFSRCRITAIMTVCIAQNGYSFQLPSREQVMESSTQILHWYRYWHAEEPGAPLHLYQAGAKVSVLELRSPKAAGVCIVDFGSCIGFRVREAGGLFALGLWPIPPAVSGKAGLIDFLKTNIVSAWPVELAQPSRENRPQGPASVDGSRLHPIRSSAPDLKDPVVTETQETLPPIAPVGTLPPADLESLSVLIRRQLVQYFPTSDCPAGSATIPRYSDQDPFLYVLADFGKCGRGILILDSNVDGAWRFSKFVMAKEDVDWFSQRIASRPLLTISVRPDQRHER